MQIVTKLPNENIQTYQPKMVCWWGELPNENIQNYQLQMIDSGGGVNYQMQIVTKLPNGTTEVAQNDSEQPILPDSQLFQSFATEVAQNDSEWAISPNSQLFPSFPTKVAQNDSEQPILPDSQLFQSFPTKLAQNDSEWPISPNSGEIAHSKSFWATSSFLKKIPIEIAIETWNLSKVLY